GIVAAHEIPEGWGLLIRDGPALALQQPPVRHRLASERRRAWLEMLALAGTRAAARRMAGDQSEPTRSGGPLEAS
ncbi:MAG TPA: hypothetical protein VLT83_04815, partial [Opitutaceae bacterium]|nr:hypothetical protein [Opitutaceae bacterium]